MTIMIEVTPEGRVVCGQFALCDRIADGYVEHPVLGPVPTCRRCAAKSGGELVECEIVFDDEEEES